MTIKNIRNANTTLGPTAFQPITSMCQIFEVTYEK